MDCKLALKECQGDMEKAITYLRKKGLAVAVKRAGRAMTEGSVQAYIHAGGKIGVLVEVNCETDFVAKTDQFREFVKNIAMHITAANPLYLRREDVHAAVIEKEKEIYRAQAVETGKPEKILDKIVEGRIEKYYGESCLLEQKYVRDPDLTIQDVLNELITKTGENVSVRRFTRYQLGENGE
ncbi:MAG: translation elongation factor Ts [Deltaproteobacteria bacterium]|nr:translation elongation factor Ts [Deltaproteobacteria bacterium]